MLAWRIYYDSGETFSLDDGGPEDAPECGVVGASGRLCDVGRKVRAGKEADTLTA